MKKKTILELDRMDVEQFHAAPKIPLTIILDDVRSLNNIGSIFRTADAFAIEHIYLCGITAVPPHPDIHKTALGAEDSVAWSHESDAVSLVHRLASSGHTLCVLEQVHGSVPLQDFTPEAGHKYALVVGNEVKGVNQEIVDLAHHALEIPQRGTKHSLNVSISAGIAMWEFFRKLAAATGS